MQLNNWLHILTSRLGGVFTKNPHQRDRPSNNKQTNQDHLRLLFDSCPAGIGVVHARTGKRLYANPRLLELFAVASLDELNAHDMAETYVNRSDFDEIRSYIQSGTAFRRDIIERKRVNGERWWALLDAVPLAFMGEPTIVVWHTDVTDQKKAENKLESALAELKVSRNELQASEERLRLLFDGSPAGIVAVRIGSGQRIYANPRMLEMFGVRDLEELNKYSIAETFVLEKDWETARDYIQTGSAFRRFVMERKKVNGDRWWALLDAVPTQFMGERTIVVWHTDITEQKRTENKLESTLTELKDSKDALQGSETRLRQILDSSPAGISVRNRLTGKRSFANRQFLDMFAVQSSDELDSFGIKNTYVAEEDWEEIYTTIKSGTALHRYESERVRTNGERWWSLLDAIPTEFEGEPSTIIWHHDITDQKQAEVELSNLLETSPIGVSIIGQKINQRAYTNNQYFRLFGAGSLEQLEAFGYENSFVSKVDFELARQHFETGIGPDSSIMQRRKVNGEEWWAKIYAVPIEFRGQQTFIVWCADITDQKQAEAELVQSEKLASLGGLVAGVAHEVNTPIGIGVTAASHLHERSADLKEMLTQGNLKKSSLEEFLETALQSSAIISANLKRAADLVRSFKQVAVDQSSDETRPFNLLEYVREVMHSLDPQLRKKPSVSVALDGDQDLDMVGYPGPVAQILTNLVLNSVTHGFPGDEPGRISIRVDSEGDMARLLYRDSGRGIAPENLKRIFDPFFTTNRSGGSSGLGMHIVYNLITQKIGGAIKCTSTLGEGVVFDIRLPLRIGDE